MSFFRTQNPWMLAAGAGNDLGRTYANTMIEMARIKAAQQQAAQNESLQMAQFQRMNQRDDQAQQNWQQAFGERTANNALINEERGLNMDLLKERIRQAKLEPMTTGNPMSERRFTNSLLNQAISLTPKEYDAKQNELPPTLNPVWGAMEEAITMGVPGATEWASIQPTMQVNPGVPSQKTWNPLTWANPGAQAPSTNYLVGSMLSPNVIQTLNENPGLLEWAKSQGLPTEGLASRLQGNMPLEWGQQRVPQGPQSAGAKTVGKYKILEIK